MMHIRNGTHEKQLRNHSDWKFILTARSQYAFISLRSGVCFLILNWTTALSWPSTFKLMCSDSPPFESYWTKWTNKKPALILFSTNFFLETIILNIIFSNILFLHQKCERTFFLLYFTTKWRLLIWRGCLGQNVQCLPPKLTVFIRQKSNHTFMWFHRFL